MENNNYSTELADMLADFRNFEPAGVAINSINFDYICLNGITAETTEDLEKLTDIIGAVNEIGEATFNALVPCDNPLDCYANWGTPVDLINPKIVYNEDSDNYGVFFVTEKCVPMNALVHLFEQSGSITFTCVSNWVSKSDAYPTLGSYLKFEMRDGEGIADTSIIELKGERVDELRKYVDDKEYLVVED